MFGQKTHDCNNSNVLSNPWWPESSWIDFRILFWKYLGRTNCWTSLPCKIAWWWSTPLINENWSNWSNILWISFDRIQLIWDSFGFEFFWTNSYNKVSNESFHSSSPILEIGIEGNNFSSFNCTSMRLVSELFPKIILSPQKFPFCYSESHTSCQMGSLWNLWDD